MYFSQLFRVALPRRKASEIFDALGQMFYTEEARVTIFESILTLVISTVYPTSI